MDEDNKKYRKGPPSQEEISRMQEYISKSFSKAIFQINRYLRKYGVELSRDGKIYTTFAFDPEREYPVFQEPIEEKVEETPSVEKLSLESLIKKGAKGLKTELDKYVIGQDKAKKVLAVEIINHYRKIFSKENTNRKKKNILLIGNTGVGKTYLIERIAEELKLPFAKVAATDYTAEGYVGGDVDDIIRQNLLRNAKDNVGSAEIGIVYIDEIDKISASRMTTGPDVGGDKVQSAILTLIDGKEVEIVAPHDQAGRKELKERKLKGEDVKETINTKNILFILGGSFSSGKNGVSLLECIHERKMKEKEGSSSSIGFGANVDKEELIKDYKDIEVKSEDLVAYGMRHEMIGRIPARALLQDLTVEDLYRILKKNTDDSLVRQYKNEFKDLGIALEFEDGALHAMAEKSDIKTGARGLETVMMDTLWDYLFELENKGVTELVVTKAVVEDSKRELKRILEESAVKKEMPDALKEEPFI